MKLHEAIEKVLLRQRHPMSATDLAREINREKLYQRGDLQPVPASQIHARVNNYPGLFKKENGLIHLHHQQSSELNWIRNHIRELIVKGRSREYILTIVLVLVFKRAIDNANSNYYGKLLERGSEFGPGSFKRFFKNLIRDFHETTYFNFYLNFFLSERFSKEFEDLEFLAGADFSATNIATNDFSAFYSELLVEVFSQKIRSGIFITPESLAILIGRVAGLQNFSLIHNPAAGINSIPVAIKNLGYHFIYTGEEIEAFSYLFGMANLIANEIDTFGYLLDDSLRENTNGNPDLIISIPPIGRVDESPQKSSLSTLVQRVEITFFSKILKEARESDSRAIVLMPESFLTSSEIEDLEIKREIIMGNLLEGIISLPQGLLPNSNLKTSLIILNAYRKANSPYFIDASSGRYYHNTHPGKKNLNTDSIFSMIKIAYESQSMQSKHSSLEEPYSEYADRQNNIVFKSTDSLGENLSVSFLLNKYTDDDGIKEFSVQDAPGKNDPGKNLYGFLKHELGNISGTITNNLKSLNYFLVSKPVDLSERIDERPDAPTVLALFKSIEKSLNEINCLSENDLRETGKFKVGQNYPVAMRLIDEHFSNQQCKDFVSIYLNVIEASSFGVNGELGILRVLCERAMEVLGESVLNFRDGEEFFNEVKSFYPDAKKGKRLIHFMDYYDERMEKIPSWVNDNTWNIYKVASAFGSHSPSNDQAVPTINQVISLKFAFLENLLWINGQLEKYVS